MIFTKLSQDTAYHHNLSLVTFNHCGRTALVKEMEPTTFKSKSALSTSNDDFSTNDLCDLPALFTRMSTF